MAALLELAGVEAWYGRAKILHGVGFSVGTGEVVALMGRNGAGKSTTMKTVMGLEPEPQGSIRFEAKEIAGREPFAIAQVTADRQQGIGAACQRPGRQGRLVGIRGWHHERAAINAATDCRGQDAIHATQRTGQSQFAQKFMIDQSLAGQLSTGDQDAQSDRQIEAAAFLRQVCRGKIDRDATGRILEAGIDDRDIRTETFAGY